MKWFGVKLVVGTLACVAILGAERSAIRVSSGSGTRPVIRIEDVALFYKVYDASGGHPGADQLQHDYIDPGSDGLHQFAKLRNISGTTIAKSLAEHPMAREKSRATSGTGSDIASSRLTINVPPTSGKPFAKFSR